jgi:hypothetical protein
VSSPDSPRLAGWQPRPTGGGREQRIDGMGSTDRPRDPMPKQGPPTRAAASAVTREPSRPLRIPRNGPRWAVIGAAATIALGGLVGAHVGSSSVNHTAAGQAPTTITVTASPDRINPTISTAPDPVCAAWNPITAQYAAQQSDWSSRGGDVSVPATRWTAGQRELATAIVPVIQAQAADMRRLAGQAQDPLLKALMQAQAMYEDAFASRLPNYQPNDHPLWQTAVDLNSAVNSVCTAVASR